MTRHLFAVLLVGPSFAGAAIAQEQARGGPPQKVDGPTISMLIRETMVALDQADITGNYTVLRDLGASVMRASNTASDLADHFAGFRQKRISLAQAVLFDAVLDQKPNLSTDGALRLIGHFPTRPQEILFDLTFVFENNTWRVAQISAGTRAPADAPPPAAAPGKARRRA
jgi:hypothetical protein